VSAKKKTKKQDRAAAKKIPGKGRAPKRSPKRAPKGSSKRKERRRSQAEKNLPHALTLTWREPSRKKGNWTVSCDDPPVEDSINPSNAAHRRRVAKALGVTPEVVLVSYREHVKKSRTAAESEGEAAPEFTVVVRGMRKAKSTGTKIRGAGPADALREALSLKISKLKSEAVIEWTGIERACAIDIDAHDIPESHRLCEHDDLLGYFPEHLPRPLASWVTHGGGLRATFVEDGCFRADALAGVWHLGAPLGRLAGWKTEAITRTRHPAMKRKSESAGPVVWMTPSATFSIPKVGDASIQDEPSEDQVHAWLAERGMEIGQRYGHELCPFDPNPSRGNPSVVVETGGVKCFHCSRSASWGRLLGGGRDSGAAISLYDAARGLVHLAHQRYVLKDIRPTAPERLIVPAWEAMLLKANGRSPNSGSAGGGGKEDVLGGLIRDAASRYGPDVVRSASGAWLDAKTLEPRHVTSLTTGDLPWSRKRKFKAEAATNVQPLQGFRPVRPQEPNLVRDPYADNPEGDAIVVVTKPPRQGQPPPVVLGEAPPETATVEEAWQVVEEYFPGIHRGYYSGLVSGTLIAQRAQGFPPEAVVTGRTGTAKTTTPGLAATALGCRISEAQLADATTTQRHLGLALDNGPGIVLLDEAQRAEDPFRALGPILKLSGKFMTYEAKYANPKQAPLTSLVLVAGASMPASIACAPEFGRRVAAWRLEDRVPEDGDWMRHGDISQARSDDRLRAALDTITASIWWSLKQGGPSFDWRTACRTCWGAVNLRELADGGAEDVAARNAAVRALYSAWIAASDGQLASGGHWEHRHDFLDCSPGKKGNELLGELIDFAAHKGAIKAQIHDLMQTDLGPVLGPRVRDAVGAVELLVHDHGTNVGVKFVAKGVRKGQVTRGDFPTLQESGTDRDQESDQG